MKKLIIGALVGALLLFFWQFLSWTVLNIHGSNMAHTPNQDAILEVLNENLSTGDYYVPRPPDEASSEEQEAFFESRMGKPWALISYRESFEVNMGMSMFRGYLANFFAVLLLCWLLLKIDLLTFKTALLGSLFVGLIGYSTISYISGIWFEFNTMPDLLDAVVQWGLCGLWLGYYLPSRN